jgi:uncharacterized damage-inducible protein DinB
VIYFCTVLIINIFKKGFKMSFIEMFRNEFEMEAATTAKFMEIVPADKLDWQPHPKSMTIRALAGHIADIPSWVNHALTNDVLDFAVTPYTNPEFNTTEELIAIHTNSVESGRAVLIPENEYLLEKRWVMRNGDQVWMDLTKAEVIRHSLSQIIHHRAQLGVYLRLLDIPIPGSYGPSADEMGM